MGAALPSASTIFSTTRPSPAEVSARPAIRASSVLPSAWRNCTVVEMYSISSVMNTRCASSRWNFLCQGRRRPGSLMRARLTILISSAALPGCW
ncbi:Uncharacterised protein [Bordetella pertussis]|nr:Uncharacterised protein [Bordetella pertussis]